ncbi:MAG: hypothetical protein HON70_01130, partial [Lentisphaerae bacterium]|nr:hypothetical protein [Lentisphaerota bacterium]
LRTETVQLRLRADRPLPVGRVVLECTPGLKLLAVGNRSIPELAPDESAVLTWPVTAAVPGVHSLVFSDGEGGRLERQVMFHASLPPRDLTYVPEPSPVQPQALVGAHMCPLWKEGARRAVWRPIVPWRKRKPVLGWYDEGDPEVADWEITWCLDHGISFFVYCWYRTSQGGPVEQKLGHAIHDGLFNARYRDQFKFTIMWENQGKGTAGVASEEDFLKNLLPFWIETYFKHPSYLVLDGKPLLYIYRPEFLIGDLGSTEAVQSALNKAREACRAAGFKGLTLLGEYRGNNREHLQRLVDLGIDCSFAYCWPLSGNPSSPKAVEMQEEIWRERRQQSVLPEMITVSMGWDSRPWKPSSTVWRHTPEDFGDVCRRALAAAREYPEGSLSRRVVLLDNWNEYGEGHYIAPHREYGFGYLDAVRNAFAPQAPQEHVDLTPADVGLGPYDRLYQAAIRESERIGLLMKGQPAAPVTGEGLVAFWSFDEGSDPDVTLDCTGNGRGAHLHDARYAPGVQRRALVCDGSSAQTAPDPVLFPQWLTLSCWVRTDTAGQSNSWFINGVYGGSTDCGYRLGLTRGRLCWGVPETSWSHHLAANEPLPTGRWVHAAATADGEEMCIYMDGKRVAVGKRSVPVGAPLAKPVTLGNYEVGHRAHFVGLLDEVRLYDRVLAPERIAELAGRRATQKLEGGVPPGPRP